MLSPSVDPIGKHMQGKSMHKQKKHLAIYANTYHCFKINH